ncbi:MAG TPA: HPF/RaiA family ribosome-associated protein [Gemmatimonas sp.]|nr:HPF/RaiA family ribosome-associated protein [Gemmatimonas sp.]
MLVQFNTDNHVQIGQILTTEFETQLTASLDRFATQLRRVEVYFQDANADKAGQRDKRCAIEVRMAGYEPVAVSHQADTIEAAFSTATDKLVRLLDHRFDKLRHPKAHSRVENREMGLGR